MRKTMQMAADTRLARRRCVTRSSVRADALASAAACFAALVLGGAAWSQEAPFSRQFGDYRVFYSAVRSDALPDAMARTHNLPANANAVLLSVTVQHNGTNVPAALAVTAVNLAGQIRDVEMRPTQADGLVSYIGVVEIADREVLDFEILASPQDSDRTLVVMFRQSFVPQTRDAQEIGCAVACDAPQRDLTGLSKQWHDMHVTI